MVVNLTNMVQKSGNSYLLFGILFLFAVFVDADRSLDWWQSSIIYQIYPRSYKDSDGDGIGDLKGIEEKAEYIKELGTNAVWLSPIFKSPMADMGYDISDYIKIDPLFGTFDDFISLQKKFKKLGIKLILDFVPNHSSDEHEWFKKSVQRIDPYTNYYVWRDPKHWINNTIPVPPNNWVSVFGGSAWTYHPDRKQFYLHQFAEKQPDLNYNSKELLEEMKSVLRFWLNEGVDGFRMDAVPHLIEDNRFPDEPQINDNQINGSPVYSSLNHIYTNCLPGTYQVLQEFREVLNSYTQKDNHTRLMMVEAYVTIPQTMAFYGDKKGPIAHFPFNFFLMDLNSNSNAIHFEKAINKWLGNVPKDQWSNWVLGNHDKNRIASRFDRSIVDALNMLLLLLPGTAITYNGEEIGMEDTKIRWDQTTDIAALNVGSTLFTTISRDPQRTPLQWNSSSHAGFSTKVGKTWLPVNPNYYYLNIEEQKLYDKSHLKIYQELAKLRTNKVFQFGDTNIMVVSDWVLSVFRSSSNIRYAVVINLNNEEEDVTLKILDGKSQENWNVTIASVNSEYDKGNIVNIKNGFKMRPQSGLILQEIQQ